MGQQFEKDHFSEQDFLEFSQRLHKQIYQLRDKIETKGFSSGPASFGAELELYLLDEEFNPKCTNQNILKTANNPLLTEELNQYNLEINLSPVESAPDALSQMQTQLLQELDKLENHAQEHQTQFMPIGILPTLEERHLHINHMTDLPRYRALTHQLSTGKSEPFHVDINGFESLRMSCAEVTLEGANTSFQVHYKVPADDFPNLFNAAQLVTPLVLAIGANSPLFMGKKLWQETRIALFKQSIDNRTKELTEWRQPARVSFGQGWIRHSAWELFAENVALYPPVLPVIDKQNSPFKELLMHHGTVWSWNRAVYDDHGDGHLRIEFRALPAGPTVVDMIANAALMIGLTKALANNINDYLVKLPFQHAEYNFYRAAKHGLDAKILWPSLKQSQLKDFTVGEILMHLLPHAVEGLISLGISPSDANYYIDIIEQRLAKRQTGASWQLAQLEKLEQKYDRKAAIQQMLSRYLYNMKANIPVSKW
ncbi:glutamate-cysteine ligase family protein [Glaciecola sp. 1036]|uniref:glutamate-cysteine ligase family protein n=1 Tax=Alteromonadaceae TaxID=72275 RepID=UPI003D08EEA3